MALIRADRHTCEVNAADQSATPRTQQSAADLMWQHTYTVDWPVLYKACCACIHAGAKPGTVAAMHTPTSTMHAFWPSSALLLVIQLRLTV